MTRHRDGNGQPWLYLRDNRGNLLDERRPDGIVIRHGYDSPGRRIWKDADGDRWTFAYDDFGNMRTRTNPEKGIERFESDATGVLLSHTAADDGKTVFTNDTLGRPTVVTDAPGHETFVAYFPEGQIARVTFPGGAVLRFTLNAAGQVTRIEEPEDVHREFGYDREGALVLAKHNGIPATLTRDDRGRVVSADHAGVRTEYRLDPAGNAIETEDALGGKTVRSYDPLNRVKTIRNALNATANVGRDGNGNPSSVTDANGNSVTFKRNGLGLPTVVTGSETTYTYDPLDRPVSITNALGKTLHLKYDERGNMTEVTDRNGARWSFVHDKRNRRTGALDPLDNITLYEYDKFDRRTAVVDALKGRTEFSYDVRGNRVSVKTPGDKAIRFEFDLLGRCTAIIDALNRRTRYVYNAIGRLIAVIDPLDGRTSYGYDATGNLTWVRDANGHVKRFGYDATRRLAWETNARKQKTHYVRNAAGDVIRRIWPDKTWTAYKHDANSRLTERRYGDGRFDLFEFDRVGNTVRVANANLVESYVYDKLHRQVSVVNETLGKTTHLAYDDVDNLTYMSSPKAPGTGTHFGYDLAGNITSARFPEGANKDNFFAYDGLSRMTEKHLANGTSALMSYDADGQTKSIRHFASDGSEMLSFLYDHDGVGNPIEILQEDGRKDLMAYDVLDRIKSHTRDGRTTEFGYDGVGNRIWEKTSKGVVVSKLDELNRLLSRGGVAFGYDLRENRTWKKDANGVTAYSYNIENQMTGVVLPGGVEYKFGFDAHGRRVYKEYEVGGTRVANHSLYHGRQMLYELNKKLAPLAMYGFLPRKDSPYGDLIRRKFYGYKSRGSAGGSGGKQTIGNTHFYHGDALGSKWKMTNHQGVEIFAYDYDAFGGLANSEFTEPYNRFLYTGKEHDFAKGLTHMDARMYDPETGAWLQRDPMNLATLMLPHSVRGIVNLAGTTSTDLLVDVRQQNGRNYVANSPFRYNDPTGLWVESPIDAASFWMGVMSFRENWKAGNNWDAALDAVGVVADGIGLATPGVVVGAGFGIQLGRTGSMALVRSTSAARTAGKAAKGAKAASRLFDPAKELAKYKKASKIAEQGTTDLRTNLIREGIDQGKDRVAHHIVAQGAPGTGKSRKILNKFGIDIHSPANGVFLLGNHHRKTHTKEYFDNINKMLESAESKKRAFDILNDLRKDLLRESCTGG